MRAFIATVFKISASSLLHFLLNSETEKGDTFCCKSISKKTELEKVKELHKGGLAGQPESDMNTIPGHGIKFLPLLGKY